MKIHRQINHQSLPKFPTSSAYYAKFLGIVYLLASILATVLLINELGLGGFLFIPLQGMLICSICFVLSDIVENLAAMRSSLKEINDRW